MQGIIQGQVGGLLVIMLWSSLSDDLQEIKMLGVCHIYKKKKWRDV